MLFRRPLFLSILLSTLLSTMSTAYASVRAPEFPEGLAWLNTGGKALSLRQFRGKIVLLDFWTYACINCQHIIPDLKKLEAKYADSLVVIGVHSAKFAGEKGTDNIRKAVLRHGLKHPVVNDKDFAIWESYAIHAWPTLVLIGPDGRIEYHRSGEGVFEAFDHEIEKLVKGSEAKGLLKKGVVSFESEISRIPESPLSFPGKVLATVGGKIYIADSGHGRIVVASNDGAVVSVIDGFNDPQGIWSFSPGSENLWIADTGNQRICRWDQASKKIAVVAKDLNSPMDLALEAHLLGTNTYIAMAGSHQIYRFNQYHNSPPADLKLFAGSGIEGIVDGNLVEAQFAQPSGITVHEIIGDTDIIDTTLYTADSESSSIREIRRGQVWTLVGKGLFIFGDKDGVGDAVRLQHPQGITWHEGLLYIADTLNHKIKILDPKTRECRTWLGDGKAGYEDGIPGRMNEPSGISIANGIAYIADTNNNLIRLAKLGGKKLETLKLTNLALLSPPAKMMEKGAATKTMPPAVVHPGSVRLKVSLSLPKGYKVNKDAPNLLILKAGGAVKGIEGGLEQTIEQPAYPLDLGIEVEAGKGSIELQAIVYYCQKSKESLCLIENRKIVLPLSVTQGGGSGMASVKIEVAQGNK